jgi:hypothetical protein
MFIRSINIVTNVEAFGKSWALVAHTYNPKYSGGRDKIVVQSQPGQTVREILS